MAARSNGVNTISASVQDVEISSAQNETRNNLQPGQQNGIENKGYEHMQEQERLSGDNDGNENRNRNVTSSSTTTKKEANGELQYSVDDVPPWYTTIALGLQHFLLMFSGVLSIPLIISVPLCVHSPEAQTHLIATIFFVSGLVTLLQATFGIRLPIVQGGTFTFLLPTFAILNVRGPCMTFDPANATSVADAEEFWHGRIRDLQGAIIVSSLVQIVLGCTGAIGILLRFIGPLTIAPTIGLIGITLFSVAEGQMSTHWGIGFLTFALITVFSQLLGNVQLPLPGGKKFPVFTLFPIIISIIIAWVVCGVLTAFGVFPDDPDAYGYQARTDINSDALKNSPWFIFPYPGQWGVPTVTLAGFLGMLAGVIASMIESIGDYYACARLSGAPPPPAHAVNRGIAMEGLGCLLAGLWGTGNGTTSYSENIGAIGLTKVGSRAVIQACGAFLIVVGLCGKLNAIFSTIPVPVIGGVLAVTFGMVGAVGFSNLQFINLNSSRNLFILGVSLFLGIAVPHYIHTTENAIDTRSDQLNQILTVLLETSMFVGGATGLILDNIIKGTPEERGLVKWIEATTVAGEEAEEEETGSHSPVYNLPLIMGLLRKWSWTSIIPISPTFHGFHPKHWRKSNDSEA
ncbi:solute carrier family 23 member 1-like isoform X2 [Apostichopus japonicus]|uniref:solute carrier family 23 member 1-like isoform X2 n=1 Tax=Stichopus japonicus TaxID=307972 RepID=UPI003AB11EAC